MAKRGGVQQKMRIAHLRWLLYTKTPGVWSTAQKLQNELDFLLEEKIQIS